MKKVLGKDSLYWQNFGDYALSQFNKMQLQGAAKSMYSNIKNGNNLWFNQQFPDLQLFPGQSPFDHINQFDLNTLDKLVRILKGQYDSVKSLEKDGWGKAYFEAGIVLSDKAIASFSGSGSSGNIGNSGSSNNPPTSRKRGGSPFLGKPIKRSTSIKQSNDDKLIKESTPKKATMGKGGVMLAGIAIAGLAIAAFSGNSDSDQSDHESHGAEDDKAA